jgi:hypothetical protein
MRPVALATLALTLAAAPAPLAAQGASAPRNATVDATGAAVIRVRAAAGSLKIEGRNGLTQVRVRGTARAAREDHLKDIGLRAERVGDAVEVEALMPRHIGIGSWNDQLDLVLEVPTGVRLDVKDGSGEVEIRNVGALRLEDGSGDLTVENVAGDVEIDDASGELRARGVHGDLEVTDGSGGIEVKDVDGGFTVDEDGSGGIVAEGVRGTVHVRRDGSGEIRVSDVGGDFVIDRDGSGGVSSRNVKGQIRMPRS